MRGATAAGNDALLAANTSDAEVADQKIAFTATGFTLFDSSSEFNASGSNYIYIAIRRGPMAVPTSGTSVFGLNARTGTGANATVTGSAGVTDLAIVKNRGSTPVWLWSSRLTGTGYLSSNATTLETAAGTTILQASPWDVMDGVKVGTTSTITNASANTFINYLIDRAPGFMDVVCYTGTGSGSQSITHNLGIAPELMLIKRRSATATWIVGTQFTGSGFLYNGLNTAAADSATYNGGFGWYSQPTSTSFAVENYTYSGASGSTYVAYLFATCAGVSISLFGHGHGNCKKNS